MPNPRQIAESVNDSSKFDKSVEASYCAECGAPHGFGISCGKAPDYSVNPSNPAEKPAPATNLKR